ncbi:MAG: carbohydrate ABC transporter permease [Chloroflexi bacterium]|nr:carbohydrate ABC transporter permease [Chloroflexota bacterium]
MATQTTAARQAPYINTAPGYSYQLRRVTAYASVTLFASLLLMAFLLPFAYGAATSLKTKDQVVAGTILPTSPRTFEYEGEPRSIYKVPLDDGSVRELALVTPGRRETTFIDPTNADAGLITWQGNWRGLELVEFLDPQFGNYEEVFRRVNYPLLLRNTVAIASIGVVGTLFSSIVVAYGFVRFPIPGKRLLLLLLIGTIILPRQVTLVPTYSFFSTLGWKGTWLPLLVPHFFANAYNVFLLRQYFMTLPRELDEAAMLDGAGPIQILLRVIIPQSWPVIVSVALFHLVFAWNDYFDPLLYLMGKPDLMPISIGIQQFNYIYDQQPHLIQATALLTLVVPLVIFLMSQKVFMRGIVITGVDK